MEGSFEHGNEPSDFIKCWEFLGVEQPASSQEGPNCMKLGVCQPESGKPKGRVPNFRACNQCLCDDTSRRTDVIVIPPLLVIRCLVGLKNI
jgi:hypothetical protein